MAKNKVLVLLDLEDGCSQEEDEVSIAWRPVNFMIYSDLFPSMIDEAIAEWLSENKLRHLTEYELILQHVIERDGNGAVHSEYFEVINIEITAM